MKIDELIEELEAVKEEHGNLDVKPVQNKGFDMQGIEVEDSEVGPVWFYG